MEVQLKYRGRMISGQDVAFIQALIDKHPEASRRRLFAMRCEHWGWVQPNGQLRDRLWRSMMLELHRAGHIELAPVRCRPANNVTARQRPKAVAVDSRPLRTTLAALQPLAIRQVRATKEGLRLGLGQEARSNRANRPRKEILGYPLDRRLRTLRCELR